MNTQSIEHYCQSHAVKLTPLRQRVLDILQQRQQPMTAYAVLDALKEYNPKAQVMSVYRVLDFLLEKGLIHRLESLNAFIVCSHLSVRHLSQWLICERCGLTEESVLTDFSDSITRLEEITGFRVTSPTIELRGICQDCQQQSPS